MSAQATMTSSMPTIRASAVGVPAELGAGGGGGGSAGGGFGSGAGSGSGTGTGSGTGGCSDARSRLRAPMVFFGPDRADGGASAGGTTSGRSDGDAPSRTVF